MNLARGEHELRPPLAPRRRRVAFGDEAQDPLGERCVGLVRADRVRAPPPGSSSCSSRACAPGRAGRRYPPVLSGSRTIRRRALSRSRDPISLDDPIHHHCRRCPVHRQLAKETRRVYVATGFKKRGMTHGTVASRIRTDLITGRPNPWTEAFDTHRFKPTAATREFVAQGADVTTRIARGVIRSEGRHPDRLRPGEGAAMTVHDHQVAAYRDETGVLHTLDPACRHWAASEIGILPRGPGPAHVAAPGIAPGTGPFTA